MTAADNIDAVIADGPTGPRERSCPPAVFFFLHVCTAWPVGVIGLALGSSLVKAGVPVHQAAAVIAASTIAFTMEFIWAPLVDSCLTRRFWFGAGGAVMCGCLTALLLAAWNPAEIPLLTLLSFAASSGAAIAAVAVKGIMAYDVPVMRLGAASGAYTAGGIFAKALGGALTLWLLSHASSRAVVAGLSVGLAALAGTAILLTVPRPAWPIRELPFRLRSAIADLWALARTRGGLLVGLLCVVPFGAGTESGLIGAISHEWSVTPDQLAGFSVLGAPTSIVGALIAAWLSTRIGPWRVYLTFGWLMIGAVLCLTFAPRAAMTFLGVELLYRALASGCYAALLGIVMTAIGKGAASTKAAGLWSLSNLAVAYPALLEGTVHDRAGTQAMLLTDVVLGVAGFGLLLLAARWLGFRLDGKPASGAEDGPAPVSSTPAD